MPITTTISSCKRLPTPPCSRSQRTPAVTVTGGTYTYDGNAHPATATAVGVDGHTPVNGTFSFTYTLAGNSTAPTNAGTYAVTANFTSSDPNYSNATGSGSITISSATLTYTADTCQPTLRGG